MFLKNHPGFTYMELMIAIAIVAIISVISVVYIGGNINDEVHMVSEQLKADIRTVRNLAVSRVTYNFDENYSELGLGEVFPPGGYGIYVDPFHVPHSYLLYADSGVDGSDANLDAKGYDSDTDPVIKVVTIENNDIEVRDLRSSTIKYFAFKSENEVDTNFGFDSYGRYQMLVRWPGPGYPEKGYQGILRMGERSDDGYIWTQLGISYSTYNPPEPDDDDHIKDPIIPVQL